MSGRRVGVALGIMTGLFPIAVLTGPWAVAAVGASMAMLGAWSSYSDRRGAWR